MRVKLRRLLSTAEYRADQQVDTHPMLASRGRWSGNRGGAVFGAFAGFLSLVDLDYDRCTG
jgi:hypothetical protein